MKREFGCGGGHVTEHGLKKRTHARKENEKQERNRI
jgi:hypothetical protein